MERRIEQPELCPHCGEPMQFHRWHKTVIQGEELRIPVYRCPACHDPRRPRAHGTDVRRQRPI